MNQPMKVNERDEILENAISHASLYYMAPEMFGAFKCSQSTHRKEDTLVSTHTLLSLAQKASERVSIVVLLIHT